MSYLQGKKYIWRLPAYDAKAIARIASDFTISFPVAHTLFSRGLTSKDAINEFLFTSFERDVAHPSLMKDAEKAVDRILHAINHKEPLLVFGDYDVDGITSSALMMICLLPLGAKVNFFLPHRVRDGYGISTKVVERAARNGYKVIVTVDNGITAFEPAAAAKRLGIDLIITDHHRPHEQVPDAYAIVNPNQTECEYPFKVLAGVGVSFKLLSLLYERLQLKMPPKAYELLLLGTIADVVPLLGENRFWVRHGLSYVNRVESLSFKVLKENGNVTKSRLSSTDIGFSIAPQINALGRLEDPRQGVKFLIGADEREVHEVGRILLELNTARKEIEKGILQEIVDKVESGQIDVEKENCIIASSSKWPPGVIGLVASRIVGMYGKPTILLHITKNGIAKGSCRSIPEFNMFNALQQAEEILDQFGGHSLAAGLSLKASRVNELKDHLEECIRQTLTPFDLQQKLMIDAQASLQDVNPKLVSDMTNLEPFGHENKQPTFFIKSVCAIKEPKLLKDAHVKCSIFADGVIKPVMFFNRPEVYRLLQEVGTNPFNIAAQISENHWNGRVSIELNGLDIALDNGEMA